ACRLARRRRAARARELLSQALRRRPDDPRGPARAGRAVPGRHRRAARGLSRDRAHEHESGARLVPPAPARARDRPRRARPAVGGRGRRRALGEGGLIAAPAAWSGSYTLPAAAAPVAIAVRVHGSSATVSLGPGHAGATEVAFAVRGKRIRFRFPGLPRDLSF